MVAKGEVWGRCGNNEGVWGQGHTVLSISLFTLSGVRCNWLEVLYSSSGETGNIEDVPGVSYSSGNSSAR